MINTCFPDKDALQLYFVPRAALYSGGARPGVLCLFLCFILQIKTKFQPLSGGGRRSAWSRRRQRFSAALPDTETSSAGGWHLLRRGLKPNSCFSFPGFPLVCYSLKNKQYIYRESTTRGHDKITALQIKMSLVTLKHHQNVTEEHVKKSMVQTHPLKQELNLQPSTMTRQVS